MCDAMDNLRLLAGTRLFSQGEKGDFAYLIRSGEIEVFTSLGERDRIVARRGAGEIIGEMALIDGGPRSASARVSADCVLVPITAAQIESRITETDPILRMCLGVVIERLRETLSPGQTGTRFVDPTFGRQIGPDFNAALETLAMEGEIKRALDRGEFELYFQPIVQLSTGDLRGFEALIRWNHPERGLVMPGAFIGFAETSGQIVGITDWCLREVTRVFPRLLAASVNASDRRSGTDLFVSVNISGHDLVRPAFADTVQSILDDGGLAARHVKLEVTESMLMKDPQGARAILETCRKRGMGIAVDDFGTGYSSLSHLSTLPLTTIKIDRAFVFAIATDPTSRKIVSTIRNLARELDLAVVAEGIETEVQARLLGAMNCEFGQGFLYSRPVSVDCALDLIGAWPWRRSPLAVEDEPAPSGEGFITTTLKSKHDVYGITK